jgi:hypothetical protein
MGTISRPGRAAEAETFDEAFAGDPLADRYREFAARVIDAVDPTSLGRRYVELGRLGADLLAEEHRLDPGGYDRARATAKLADALRLSGVPESMVKPQEIIGVFWVAKLDRSIPGGRCRPRSFTGDDIPDDWYGDGVRLSALRLLVTCIGRASKSDEPDAWEYKPGFEPLSREILARLRAGDLSTQAITAMIRARREHMAGGGTPADASRSAALARLATLADSLKKLAAAGLGKSPAQVRDFLETRGVIPASPTLTMPALARVLSPADARVLIQELACLAASDPTRAAVIRSLETHAASAAGRFAERSAVRRLAIHI